MRYRIHFGAAVPTCEVECTRFEFRTSRRLKLFTVNAAHGEDCCDVLFPHAVEWVTDAHGHTVWTLANRRANEAIAKASRR